MLPINTHVASISIHNISTYQTGSSSKQDEYRGHSKGFLMGCQPQYVFQSFYVCLTMVRGNL